MSRDRIFRLTTNPLAEPPGLDRGYVAKIHAMLDVFVAAGVLHSQISLHEPSDVPLAYAVVAWAVGRCPISVHLATTSGRTYEVWHLGIDDVFIVVFPRERLLYGLDPDLQSKIDRIRREADERIQSLVEAEAAAQAPTAGGVENQPVEIGGGR